MSICHILILLSLIMFTNNKNYCLKDATASKGDDCKDLEITSLDYHCCYVKGKINNEVINSCVEIKPWEYKDLKKYIEDMNKESVNAIEGIDCESIYLQLSLISLLFLLL